MAEGATLARVLRSEQVHDPGAFLALDAEDVAELLGTAKREGVSVGDRAKLKALIRASGNQAVPVTPRAPVEGALYVPLADDGLDSCDSYAFCEACLSSVDARRSCASRLALTGGAVVAEIDGGAKEGYKHGGTAATALLLNAAEVCAARRLRRR